MSGCRSKMAIVFVAGLLFACQGKDGTEGSPCEEGQLCGEVCVDTSSHREHCGACDRPCGELEACDGGVCILSCPEGREICDGSCVDIVRSVENCGACGQACGEGERCVDGACEPGDETCDDGLRLCGGACVDVETDAEHCGACDVACADGRSCVEGSCRCPEGLESCPEGCFDTSDDPLHCGGCGQICAAGQACVDGLCVCPDSMEFCAEGCVDTSLDPQFCKSCDNDCTQLPHVDVVSCGEEGCDYTCLPGYGDCTDDPGCETDLLEDEENCGGCGFRCADLDGVEASLGCDNGVCQLQCAPNRGNCDWNPANGCETDLTEAENCGRCGLRCIDLPETTGATCNEGKCTLAGCNENWGDCDEDPFNGCETDLLTNTYHCGACGQACATSCFEGSCAVPVEVKASFEHTCARLNSGEVWCWGANLHGKLGVPLGVVPEQTSVPVRVTGITNAVSIDVGENHSCAVLADGTVKCWGNNYRGQLGDGTTVASPAPVPAVYVEGAVEVAVGRQHSCARTETGDVYCWGDNAYGQTASGASHDMYPVKVKDLVALRSLSSEGNHTCVIAQTEEFPEGTVRCWGQGTAGQLGFGLLENSSVPVGPNMPLDGVSAGGEHTCAWMKQDFGGSGFCWGFNLFGQVGGSIPTTAEKHPNVVGLYNLSQIVSIDSGLHFNCARTLDGGVHCWGENSRKQFGMATPESSNIAPVAIPPLTDAEFVQIGLGLHHGCGVDAQGDVFCWGSNQWGQLGDGTTENREQPVLVKWGD